LVSASADDHRPELVELPGDSAHQAGQLGQAGGYFSDAHSPALRGRTGFGKHRFEHSPADPYGEGRHAVEH